WEEVARLPPAEQARFEQTLKENDHLARQDARGIAKLREACGSTPLVLVPRFELDVHDLKGLYATSDWLWGDRRLDVTEPGR
ncbi:MAG TPA: ArsA family ATPase, partial [Archangium sp.]